MALVEMEEGVLALLLVEVQELMELLTEGEAAVDSMVLPAMLVQAALASLSFDMQFNWRNTWHILQK